MTRLRWALILAAALIVRLALGMRSRLIEVDGAYWAGFAEALERGDLRHGLSTAWPPFYPVAIALGAALARLIGAVREPALFECAARVVSAVAGTALLVPLFALARRVVSERGASIAVLLAAFHPRLLQYSAAALSEMAYTLLLVAGVAALASADATADEAEGKPGSRDAAAGVCFGLSFLVRPEGLLLACVHGVAGLFVRGGSRGRWRRSATLVGVALCVAAPDLLFLHARTGGWTLGDKGPYNFWRAYATDYATLYPPPTGLAARVNEAPELAVGVPDPQVQALAFVARRPGLFFGRCVERLATLIVATAPVTVYLPFALLALLAPLAPRAPSGGRWRRLVVTLCAMPVLYAPFSVDRRLLVPAVPFLLVATAAGCLAIERWIARRRKPSRRFTSVSGWLAVALAVFGVAYAWAKAGSFGDAPEHRAAGEWLRGAWPRISSQQFAERAGPVVMSRKPWVAFYAGGLKAELPPGPAESVIARARARGVDLLVVDERSVEEGRLALGALLDTTLAPKGLEAVHVETTPRRLVIYAVRPPDGSVPARR